MSRRIRWSMGEAEHVRSRGESPAMLNVLLLWV